jgi:hypothetical protein
MARKPAKRAAGNGDDTKGVTAAEKIAGLLALIAIKGMDTDSAALKLDAIGFSAREIADLLDVGLNYVNVARHRKSKGKRKAS